MYETCHKHLNKNEILCQAVCNKIVDLDLQQMSQGIFKNSESLTFKGIDV